MAKVWEYQGYTIDEGLKPHDENFKAIIISIFSSSKRTGSG